MSEDKKWKNAKKKRKQTFYYKYAAKTSIFFYFIIFEFSYKTKRIFTKKKH